MKRPDTNIINHFSLNFPGNWLIGMIEPVGVPRAGRMIATATKEVSASILSGMSAAGHKLRPTTYHLGMSTNLYICCIRKPWCA